MSKTSPIPLPELVLVQGGEFLMGSEPLEREQPIHKVKLKDFYIGKYPITNQQFASFLRDYQSNTVKSGKYKGEKIIESHPWGVTQKKQQWVISRGYEQHPIIAVSWYGALTYCEWLSEQTGKVYRLPSEAEWEYAARGGIESKGFLYSGGNKLKEVGWYRQNSHRETKRLGLKQSNELGLYDMSGNVREWCADHWHNNYDGAPEDGSIWIGEEGDGRVVRGGSWDLIDVYCRVSYRLRFDAWFRLDYLGFRVSRY